jgi:hypothetical protein
VSVSSLGAAPHDLSSHQSLFCRTGSFTLIASAKAWDRCLILASEGRVVERWQGRNGCVLGWVSRIVVVFRESSTWLTGAVL